MNSSEDEGPEVFFQNILEESIDEDLQEPLPLSTRQGQEENRPKIKSERLNKGQKKTLRQNEKAGSLYEHCTVLEERFDEDFDDPLPLPSTSKGQKQKTPKIKSERVKERKTYTAKKKIFTQKENKMPQPQASEVKKKDLDVGDFILAGFRSTKGKRTYKYVCLIEDINQEKIVVKGLKSKKDNREFKFVENDISIIDIEDVISYLPNAVLNKQKDTVIFPFKVEVFECK